MGTPTLREGQVIAIPVLTRHITHSTGVCKAQGAPLTESCVMADALRDRFPEAQWVSVGNSASDFTLDGLSVSLDNGPDMQEAIRTFDRSIDRVNAGWTVENAMAVARKSIPRVVHATVNYAEQA